MLLVLVACLVALNVVIGRYQTARAATPTEYKQLFVIPDKMEKTLNDSSREGWELAQIYRLGPGSSQVCLVLKK